MWWQDKERMCKSLRDLDLSGEKKGLSACSVPCDSWKNSACDSVLCIDSRQCAKNGDELFVLVTAGQQATK